MGKSHQCIFISELIDLQKIAILYAICMSTPTKRIIIPYKPHLHELFLYIKTDSLNSVELNLIASGLSKRNIPVCIHRITGFGFNFVVRTLLRRETQVPRYVVGLERTLKKLHPSSIVVFDVYHWYTLQALSYCRRHPETKLFIVAASKRWPKNPLTRFVMRCFYRYVASQRKYVTRVLVNTSEGERFVSAQLPDTPVEKLPPPVDTETFTPPPEKMWLPEGVLRIVMNARFLPYKRHEDLLCALGKLRAEGYQFSLTLVGRQSTRDTNAERAAVEECARQCGVADRVKFLDTMPKEEVAALNRAHDVLVLPSDHETIGMVVPEAMACGIPTVTSDTVGANVYVKEGETGFIFETGNVDALAACLRQCFERERLAHMGAAARAQVETNFSVPAIAARWLQHI